MLVLPRSELEVLYRSLDGVAQGDQIVRAAEYVVHPERLSETIAASVRQLADYDNQHEDFFPDIQALEEKRRVLPEVPPGSPASTVQVAALLNATPIWNLARTQRFRYIDREIRPMRTTGGAKYQDPETGELRAAATTPMLDLLLVDETDRTPIVGEVKIGGDQNLFYALIQGLMHVAAFANLPQRARLSRVYPSTFSADAKLDLFLLTIGPPKDGTRPRLAWLAEVAAFQQMQLPGATSIVRNIVCLDYVPDAMQPAWREKWRY